MNDVLQSRPSGQHILCLAADRIQSTLTQSREPATRTETRSLPTRMHLTVCEPTAMSTAMDPPREVSYLQSSCGTGDSVASLDDIAVDFIANESSEESAGEREEEIGANTELTNNLTDILTEQPTHTETVSAQRPDSLSLAMAEPERWTSRGDGEVTLRMGESGFAAEPPLTVDQMFKTAVERFGSYTALGWKEGEQTKTMNYQEYYQACRTAAKSFLKVQDKLPHLKAIIQYKDALKEKRPNLYTWVEFMELGRDESNSQLDDIIATQKPNQCCTLIYTSGTTGQPKGVMLSHDNLTWTAFAVGRHVRLTEATKSQEIVVSYLPLSHIAAQMVDIWVTMKVGGATYFAQPDALKGSLVNTMREVRPTAFMGVPRVWEKMQEKMKSVGAKSSTVRRKVAVWAKGVGLKTNLSKMNQNGAMARTPVNYRLAKKLVFRKVRKALGLDRCTKCYTGAAPITKDTLEFFLSLDIPVYELYGMSESTGPHTISLPNAFRLTSVGKLIPGCETKIHSPDQEGNGEICFWGRHVFMGYLNQADKTEDALDAEGWLHSGDLGKHDDNGFLFITGRIKELIITAGGENIPPVPIEDAVKEAVSLVSNAMLIGDKRKFLAMLLTIKCQVNGDTGAPEDELTPEAVELCRKLGSNATRVSEIAGGRDRVIHAAIQEGINRVNENATSNAQRIQKWIILDQDFSITGGELGPTMKLKRPVVMKMYKEQVEHFYKEVVTPSTPDNSLPPK
uniref:Long-chain-fatty-acid--CoA ligase ACSBG2 n=1 Tax=Salmo trutta TaxID=8032 RepID=A0A674BFP9_SALTR